MPGVSAGRSLARIAKAEPMKDGRTPLDANTLGRRNMIKGKL
jgi:hypothetical protein